MRAPLGDVLRVHDWNYVRAIQVRPLPPTTMIILQSWLHFIYNGVLSTLQLGVFSGRVRTHPRQSCGCCAPGRRHRRVARHLPRGACGGRGDVPRNRRRRVGPGGARTTMPVAYFRSPTPSPRASLTGHRDRTVHTVVVCDTLSCMQPCMPHRFAWLNRLQSRISRIICACRRGMPSVPCVRPATTRGPRVWSRAPTTRMAPTASASSTTWPSGPHTQ